MKACNPSSSSPVNGALQRASRFSVSAAEVPAAPPPPAVRPRRRPRGPGAAPLPPADADQAPAPPPAVLPWRWPRWLSLTRRPGHPPPARTTPLIRSNWRLACRGSGRSPGQPRLYGQCPRWSHLAPAFCPDNPGCPGKLPAVGRFSRGERPDHSRFDRTTPLVRLGPGHHAAKFTPLPG